MESKHELINKLIAKFGFESYLEIGLGPLQETWKHVNVNNKTCVDVIKVSESLPSFLGTSDDFFAQSDKTFDLIYIDGDHQSDQVRKDLVNSLKSLNEGGLIIMHDIAPSSKAETSPRSSGDAFKVFMEIRKNPHLQSYTYFFRSGDAVGCVWRGINHEILDLPAEGDAYNIYENRKKDILRPIDYDTLIETFIRSKESNLGNNGEKIS